VTYNTYLPIVNKQLRPRTVGVQIEGRAENQNKFLVEGSSVLYHVRWYENENEFSSELKEDYNLIRNYKPVIQIKNAPMWMRVYPDKICSRIHSRHYRSFGEFVRHVITVFDPIAVEIWNEPDVDPLILAEGHDYYYGGWNETGNELDAGREYGRMLDIVYHCVKSSYPNVSVFAGALSCHDEKFIDGFTQTGEYDVISFHAYPYYNGLYGDVITRNSKKIRKYDSITPLAVTETSLLWWGDTKPTEGFEIEQANYWKKAIMFAGCEGIDYLYWYALNNTWNHCGLVEGGKLKPVWHTYKEWFTNGKEEVQSETA
jgi:hypothetical protein